MGLAFFIFLHSARTELSFQLFYPFGTTNGAVRNPNAGLTQGVDGNLYGTTTDYSGQRSGEIFRISLQGVLTNLWTSGSFHVGARLLQSADGNLYGTTMLPNPVIGPSSSYQGVLFRLAPDGSMTSLAEFGGTNGTGSQCLAALIQISDGTIFGTTYSGGTATLESPLGAGTVFEFRTDGIFSGLLSFPLNQTTCRGPKGGLIQASDGNLYGTTTDTTIGGFPSSTKGTIFRISAQGLTTILTFYGTNGAYPASSLLAAGDDALYGTATSGGTFTNGTVFKITTNGIFTSLFSFAGTNGANPTGDLIQLNDGNLYGTTSGGGTNNSGTIFRITTSGALTTIFHFNSFYTGGSPQGGLCLARDGNLYGTTSTGGSGGGGTIFRLVSSPIITSATQSNGGVVLNWSSFTDAVYRIEYRTNVKSGSWLTLATNIVSAGNTASFIDSAVGDAQRFYRVVLLPH